MFLKALVIRIQNICAIYTDFARVRFSFSGIVAEIWFTVLKNLDFCDFLRYSGKYLVKKRAFEAEKRYFHWKMEALSFHLNGILSVLRCKRPPVFESKNRICKKEETGVIVWK